MIAVRLHVATLDCRRELHIIYTEFQERASISSGPWDESMSTLAFSNSKIVTGFRNMCPAQYC